eukprot:gb/GECG01007859.1/.p1 GENE.gb/GECG01007859.1/~~gb/GECG01007859.1/.p1  ORF type:complete len:1128 (+),score=145.55 gb/GECG01007859.1/:1-3384(+)
MEQYHHHHHSVSITPSLLFSEEDQPEQVDIRVILHDDHDIHAQRSAHAALIQSLYAMDPEGGPQSIRSVFMEALEAPELQENDLDKGDIEATHHRGATEGSTRTRERLVLILRCPWAHKEDIAWFIAQYARRRPYHSVLILSELSDYGYDSLHRANHHPHQSKDDKESEGGHRHAYSHRQREDLESDSRRHHEADTGEVLPFLRFLEVSAQKYLEEQEEGGGLHERDREEEGKNVAVPTVSVRFVVLPQSCIASVDGGNPGEKTKNDSSGVYGLHWPEEVSMFSSMRARFLTCMFVEDIGKRNRPAFSSIRDKDSVKSLYDISPSDLPTPLVQEMKYIGHILLCEMHRRNLDISGKGACFGMGRLSTWIGNCVMQQAFEDPSFSKRHEHSSNSHLESAALILLDRSLDLVGPLLQPHSGGSSSNKDTNPISIRNVSSNLLNQVWSFWEYAAEKRHSFGVHATSDNWRRVHTTAWLPILREQVSEESLGAVAVDGSVLKAWDSVFYSNNPLSGEEIYEDVAKHMLYHLFRSYWRFGPSLFSAQDQLNCHFRYLICLSGIEKALDYLIQFLVEYLGIHDEASELGVRIEHDGTWGIILETTRDANSELVLLESIIRTACIKSGQKSTKLEQLTKLWFTLVRKPQASRIANGNVISFIQSILISQMEIPIWNYLAYPAQRIDRYPRDETEENYDLSAILPFLMQTKDQLHGQAGGFLLDPWMVVLDLVYQYIESRWYELAGTASEKKSEARVPSFGTIVHSILLVASMHGESVALADQEHLNVDKKTVQGHTFFVALKCIGTAMLLAKHTEVDRWFPGSKHQLEQLHALSSVVNPLERIIEKCKTIKSFLSSDKFAELTPEFFDSNADEKDVPDEDWEESWSQWSEEESEERQDQHDENDSTLQKIRLIQKGLENNVVRKWLRKSIEVSHMRKNMREFAQEASNADSSLEESPLTDFSCLSGLRFSLNSLQEPYSPYFARLVDLILNNDSEEIPELVQLGSKAQQLSRATAQAAYATIGAAESFVKRGVGALSSTFGEAFKSSLHDTAGKFLGSTVGSVKQHMTSWKSHPANFSTIVVFITGGVSAIDVASLEALRRKAENKYFGSGKRVIIISSHLCSNVSILHDFTCA